MVFFWIFIVLFIQYLFFSKINVIYKVFFRVFCVFFIQDLLFSAQMVQLIEIPLCSDGSFRRKLKYNFLLQRRRHVCNEHVIYLFISEKYIPLLGNVISNSPAPPYPLYLYF